MYRNKFNNNSQNITIDWNAQLESIKEHIYQYVNQNKISIRELAAKSEIPASTLSSLLYEHPSDCKLSTIVKISKTLGLSIDELINGPYLQSTIENINLYNSLPANSRYLVDWFVKHQDILYNKNSHISKKAMSVIDPLITNDGLMKMTSRLRYIDIMNMSDDLKSKVFLGLKLVTEAYMPLYTPHTVLLIAHDRNPFEREHVVVLIKDNIFIARQRIENGIMKFYGLLDNQYRCDITGVSEVVGYITGVLPDDSKPIDTPTNLQTWTH